MAANRSQPTPGTLHSMNDGKRLYSASCSLRGTMLAAMAAKQPQASASQATHPIEGTPLKLLQDTPHLIDAEHHRHGLADFARGTCSDRHNT